MRVPLRTQIEGPGSSTYQQEKLRLKIRRILSKYNLYSLEKKTQIGSNSLPLNNATYEETHTPPNIIFGVLTCL